MVGGKRDDLTCRTMRFLAVVTSALCVTIAACAAPRGPQTAVYSGGGSAQPNSVPDRDYLVYAASEATDRIALIRFGPAGARVEKEVTVGIMPADADGPHGVAVAP